jgi:hypothetical protein
LTIAQESLTSLTALPPFTILLIPRIPDSSINPYVFYHSYYILKADLYPVAFHVRQNLVTISQMLWDKPLICRCYWICSLWSHIICPYYSVGQITRLVWRLDYGLRGREISVRFPKGIRDISPFHNILWH